MGGVPGMNVADRFLDASIIPYDDVCPFGPR